MTQRGRELRRMLVDLVEKVAHPPDEDPGIPEIAVVAHFFGLGAVGLFDEAFDPRWFVRVAV